MKKMKFLSMLFSMLLAVTFVGCQSDSDDLEYDNPENIIVGTWKITKFIPGGGHFNFKPGTVLVFHNNGTFTDSSNGSKHTWKIASYKDGKSYTGGIYFDGIYYDIISLSNPKYAGERKERTWTVGLPDPTDNNNDSGDGGYIEKWELHDPTDNVGDNGSGSNDDEDDNNGSNSNDDGDDDIFDFLPDDIPIPVHPGNNPPVIEGAYYVDPFVTVYCTDYGKGGYAPGTRISPQIVKFSNQNTIKNTVDYTAYSVQGTESTTGTGAFIRGSGNNFTAVFTTTGQNNGISIKTALVISGTKANGGIRDYHYAFVMLEKGYDPGNKVMAEGGFRVFKDQDGFSEYTTWNRARSLSDDTSVPEWAIYSIVH